MHPILLELGGLTIFSYGFFIVLGAFLAYRHMVVFAKKDYNVRSDTISSLLLLIIAMAFIGGKVLFYLEDPSLYISDPSLMLDDMGNGFVFFGSLLFAVPAVIWFFKEKKLPIWGMLDLTAFSAIIAHGFGRIGCFLAGCCHGVPTDSVLGVMYTDPACQADPLNVHLHPSQLYAVTLLLGIFLLLKWLYKRPDRFPGQLFLIYVMLYSVGRGVIEEFRGDEARGYLFDGLLSHSQFISLILISIAAVLYFHRRAAAKPSR